MFLDMPIGARTIPARSTVSSTRTALRRDASTIAVAAKACTGDRGRSRFVRETEVERKGRCGRVRESFNASACSRLYPQDPMTFAKARNVEEGHKPS
jgi:hypothetical protein